jgi:ATP-dependent Lon protease
MMRAKGKPASTTHTPAAEPKTLPPDKLGWNCPPSWLDFKSTADVPPATGIVGQDKAVEALRLGMELFRPGYNAFVCGLSGTGKMTTVKLLLEHIRPRCPLPRDRCYVNDFFNPNTPVLITLPRGQGRVFKRAVDDMIRFLRARVPLELEGDDFRQQRASIRREYEEQGNKMFATFDAGVRQHGFALGQVQMGPVSRPDLLPIVDGKEMTIQEYAGKIREAEGPEAAAGHPMIARYQDLRNELDEMLRENRRLSKEMMARLDLLEEETVRDLASHLAEEIRSKFPDPKINGFLKQLVDDVSENVDVFKEDDGDDEGDGMPPGFGGAVPDAFRAYGVNVVLDNSNREGCPVVIETTPNFKNLFGHIQATRQDLSNAPPDFMNIHGGSLLQADGGYLVFNATDALTETQVWKTLKRALTYRQLEIQSMESQLGLLSSPIKPEPIDLNVKVILIGESYLYHMLYSQDEDFKQIFKVKVDFDSTIRLNRANARKFLSVISKVCQDESLKPLTSKAAGRLLEYGVREAGMREKLSTRFSEIADVVREADYWAGTAGRTGREHVDQAIRMRIERNNMLETHMQEYIEQGKLIIATSGRVAGQVNGLSVYDMGDHRFGRPTRITATTAFGRAGLINIEREAKLSGKSHDKGVLIIGGFLRRRFAQKSPLTLSASLCFEQSYSGVDGDSASSTEIYALLSSLSGIPLNQGIAVTGSVNQLGEIQPIGGVNEKIEGFFDVCAARSLTGDQGVMIPTLNVRDLMLRQDVVQAVKNGQFNIYAVNTIDRGIEVLTGVAAGRQGKNGIFPPGTVNRLVQDRLTELKPASDDDREKEEK